MTDIIILILILVLIAAYLVYTHLYTDSIWLDGINIKEKVKFDKYGVFLFSYRLQGPEALKNTIQEHGVESMMNQYYITKTYFNNKLYVTYKR